ncbi:hypothetical protein BDB00DRAFT_793910 [Zychaea mexicana]|uniref:uncharacterized protein n=1 Tax=Zychaea mexicana TaxID=64656 RepID=UPI0022FDEF95|nr:uncharacterized protein BDB00DRAFT_793910 [Zychaea mexicana]KAI9499425.1 hypothetical protein BDB00DRAFT_793910 [Zychaea mexicana]
MQANEKHELPNQKKHLSHVTPLPKQSIVFRPMDQAESDSSFSQYIDRQFQPYSAVLHKRASLPPEQTKSISPASMQCQQQQHQHKAIETTEQQAKTKPTPPLQSASNNTRAFDYDDEERARQQQQQIADPWWVLKSDEDGIFSIGILLFLFGFIFPPLWWIGACWPRHPRERAGKMAERWQKLNLIMSLSFSVILIIALIIVAVIYSRMK